MISENFRDGFDAPVNRRNTGSYKWDSNPVRAEGYEGNLPFLPMWVADMDFRTAPAIIDVLRRRVDHGVFGYTKVTDEYYHAICNWFSRRHSWNINPEHIIYTTGVVPALSAIIKGLAPRGSNVILQSPVYNLFFTSIRNNGCMVCDNPLQHNSQGRYTIDFDNLAEVVGSASLLILCNPHNPVGRLWSADELRRVAEICRDNNVTVVSDEIHCELTYNGNQYVPFAPVAEAVGCKYVVACSPSKAFNTAGLQIANIVCPDKAMRTRIDRAINDNEVCDVNPFGVAGLIAAYNESEQWLDALCAYLWENYRTVLRYLAHHCCVNPGPTPACNSNPADDSVQSSGTSIADGSARLLKITPLEATYLLWIDVSATGLDGREFADRLLRRQNMRVAAGADYGPGGENFIRLNIATRRELLLDGLARIADFLRSFG